MLPLVSTPTTVWSPGASQACFTAKTHVFFQVEGEYQSFSSSFESCRTWLIRIDALRHCQLICFARKVRCSCGDLHPPPTRTLQHPLPPAPAHTRGRLPSVAGKPGILGCPSFFFVSFQDNPGAVHDLNLLGNFVDNHDMQRIGLYCKGDVSRMRNAVAWTMMMQGMPIIFYGTEHGFNTTHPPHWNAGFSTTTPGYSFLQALNNIRKALKLHTATMKPA